MSADGVDPVQMAIVEVLGMADMYRRYFFASSVVFWQSLLQ